MQMLYSIQQIKFEFVSYIREFGSDGADWAAGLTDGASAADISRRAEIDLDRLIWICKPALSARAAFLVHEHMVARHQLRAVPNFTTASDLNWVFICRENAASCARETMQVAENAGSKLLPPELTGGRVMRSD